MWICCTSHNTDQSMKDEPSSTSLAVSPAQGRKQGILTSMAASLLHSKKTTRNLEQVTEMPKTFTLNKKLSSFSDYKR